MPITTQRTNQCPLAGDTGARHHPSYRWLTRALTEGAEEPLSGISKTSDRRENLLITAEPSIWTLSETKVCPSCFYMMNESVFNIPSWCIYMYIQYKFKKLKKKHRKPLKKLFFLKIVIKIDSQTTKHSIYSLFNGLYLLQNV